MGAIRTTTVAVMALLLLACNHPIEIVGEGDVLSASGDRNCFLEDYQAGADSCRKNMVVHAYQETYYGVPREDDGWEFSHWENCMDGTANECRFDVPADAVKKNWGAKAAPLIAVFTKTNAPPPPPVAVYSYGIDPRGNLVSPLPLKDARLERRTVYFGFTGETPSRISFWCCKLPLGVEPHMPRVDDKDAPFVLRVDLGALPEDQGLSRELYADIFAGDGSYKGYSTLWTLAPPPEGIVVFNDGKQHFIDYTLAQALRVSGDGTIVNLRPGTNIAKGAFVTDGGKSNVFGGVVDGIFSQGNASVNVAGGDISRISSGVTSSLVVSGGKIGSITSETGSVAKISGGEIGRLFQETGQVTITGGTFSQDVAAIAGSLEISGGVFRGRVYDDYLSDSSIAITGGDFKSEFRYNYNAFGKASPFTFYGDLSITKPVRVGNDIYESYITGTLQEGDVISQKITCFDFSAGQGDQPPCSGVSIVKTAVAK